MKTQLGHFEFVISDFLTTKILETTHCVSKLLKTKKCDLSKAADLIKTAYDVSHYTYSEINLMNSSKQQLTLPQCTQGSKVL